ncbi:MAG: hypothetical protein MI974_13380 [Chitinophagales bacterium]|nr:hypothetical protein [Chitinophagales bacterium]
MSIMIVDLYHALKEAGASEEKAMKAAQELATYENRLNKIEQDLAVLKWMVGFNMAFSITTLFLIVKTLGI